MESIQIDNYTFKIIGKSVPDINEMIYFNNNKNGMVEDRYKVRIESEDNTTHEKQVFDLYSSLSELFTWRLCVRQYHDNVLIKLDNYIQATLIDLRLQKFIWDNFNSVPYIKSQDFVLDKKITKYENTIKQLNYSNFILEKELEKNNKQISSFQSKIDNFKNQDENKLYTLDEIKSMYNLTLKNKKDYTVKELVEVLNNAIKKLVNKNTTINDEIQRNLKVIKTNKANEKLSDLTKNPNGIIFCPSNNDINIDNLYKRGIKVKNLNRQNFYDNFQIVNMQNEPIITPNLIVSYENYPNQNFSLTNYKQKILNVGASRNDLVSNNKIEYFKHNGVYKDIKYKIDYYGIKIKSKANNEILIAQILDFEILIRDKLVRKGKTIINFIKENVLINKFGLYSNFCTEELILIYEEDEDHSSISSKNNLVSKPLEYRNQSNFILSEEVVFRIVDKCLDYIDAFNINKLINNNELTIDNSSKLTINDILIKQYGTKSNIDKIIMQSLKPIFKSEINVENIKSLSVIEFIDKYNRNLQFYNELSLTDDFDNAGEYVYIAHHNVTKPIINELVKEETLKTESNYEKEMLYKKKYLKYKEKYLKLKTNQI